MVNRKLSVEDLSGLISIDVEESDRAEAKQSKLVQTYIVDPFIAQYEVTLRQISQQILIS